MMWKCVRCGMRYTFSPSECFLCGGRVWITVRFSRLSGGGSGRDSLPRSSVTSSVGSRDKRGPNPVNVQKGGECGA